MRKKKNAEYGLRPIGAKGPAHRREVGKKGLRVTGNKGKEHSAKGKGYGENYMLDTGFSMCDAGSNIPALSLPVNLYSLLNALCSMRAHSDFPIPTSELQPLSSVFCHLS